MLRHARWLVMLFPLATSGCYDDICSLEMTITGDEENTFSWRHPQATCSANVTGFSIHTGESFGGERLDVVLSGPLSEGTFQGTVAYGISYVGICTVTISSYELVEWVAGERDHHYFEGSLECPDPLVDTSSIDGSVTIQGANFIIDADEFEI